MYDFIRIYNATSSSYIEVNDDDFYPVEKFTWNPDFVGNDLPKLATPGRHNNFKEIEVMNIEMEGHIKANTTEQYWTVRKALLNIVVPDYDQIIPIHGTIMFKINGDSESYFQRVNLTHSEVPTEALYPTVTPFRFEWDGLDGYWKALSTLAAVKI